MRRKCIILLLNILIFTVLITGISGCALRASGKAPKKAPKGYDWTINVDDTISGQYKLPMDPSKVLKCSINLRLVAWKSGGENVNGKYTGEGYIVVNIDEAGMSNEEIIYAGGGAFNRRCEKLEFKVEKYNYKKLNRNKIPMMNKVSVAPLGKFNAMASFMSNWSTILSVDETIIDADTGMVIHKRNDVSEKSPPVKMGIDLLIENERVTVEIPTYRLAWDCGFFYGSVEKSPLGSAKREKLKMPDSPRVNSDGGYGQGMEDPSKNGQNGGNNQKKQDTAETGFKMGNEEFRALFPQHADKYIEKDPKGRSGFDLNEDGIVDMYLDESGKLIFDIDFGSDILDNVEWGQG